MHANAWATLLRHIAPEEHGKLLLMTGSGMEVAIQAILRIDHEFVAFKGRLAGSQDQGRLFFVPFANIDYINFTYAIKDEEFQTMFGTLEVPAAPVAVPAAPVAVPEPEEPEFAEAPAIETIEDTQEEEAQPEPVPAAPVGPSTRTPLPIKSAILERFRSRGQGPGGPGQGSSPRPPADG